MNELTLDALKAMDKGRCEDLAHWLREWQADVILREERPSAEANTVENVPFPAKGAEAEQYALSPPSNLEVGQVRLLHPRHLPRSTGPIYAALIPGSERAEAFMAAPFSRFSVPALEGELRTDRETPCLRVLSVGFARPLSLAPLADSWLVDTLQPAELQDAVAVFRHVFHRVALPGRLASRIGPPVVHPDDPRHAYCEEQAGLMDRLWLQGREGGRSAGWEGLEYESSFERDALPLAAERRSSYGSKTVFQVEETQLLLSCFLSAGGEAVEFTITDPAGRVCTGADGFVLVGPDGRTSAPIRQGRLRWKPGPDLAACRLQRPDGTLLGLLRV